MGFCLLSSFWFVLLNFGYGVLDVVLLPLFFSGGQCRGFSFLGFCLCMPVVCGSLKIYVFFGFLGKWVVQKLDIVQLSLSLMGIRGLKFHNVLKFVLLFHDSLFQANNLFCFCLF